MTFHNGCHGRPPARDEALSQLCPATSAGSITWHHAPVAKCRGFAKNNQLLAMWLWVKTLVPLVNPKIAGKWMFIPLKMVCIGIDP